MVEIRKATEADYEAIWQIFREVISGGDAFAFDPDTGKEEALHLWVGQGMQTFVALHEGQVVGSYYLKPNQPGLGSHVANAGYMVAVFGRGRGIARAMGEHSLREAVRAGYRAMQFNFVVSTNTAAVELWKKLGFTIVGTVPQAFRHREHGFVDVHVMHRFLEA